MFVSQTSFLLPNTFSRSFYFLWISQPKIYINIYKYISIKIPTNIQLALNIIINVITLNLFMVIMRDKPTILKIALRNERKPTRTSKPN